MQALQQNYKIDLLQIEKKQLYIKNQFSQRAQIQFSSEQYAA